MNHCPNPECPDYQKLVLHDYPTTELRSILEKLKRDELKFYHIICNVFWKPGPLEKADLAAVLEPAWESYNQGKFTLTANARFRSDGIVLYSEGRLKDSPMSIEQVRLHLKNSGVFDDRITEFMRALEDIKQIPDRSVEMRLPRLVQSVSAY